MSVNLIKKKKFSTVIVCVDRVTILTFHNTNKNEYTSIFGFYPCRGLAVSVITGLHIGHTTPSQEQE